MCNYPFQPAKETYMTTTTVAPPKTGNAVAELVRDYTTTAFPSENQKASLYWGSVVSARHIASSTIENADSLRRLSIAPTNTGSTKIESRTGMT